MEKKVLFNVYVPVAKVLFVLFFIVRSSQGGIDFLSTRNVPRRSAHIAN